MNLYGAYCRNLGRHSDSGIARISWTKELSWMMHFLKGLIHENMKMKNLLLQKNTMGSYN
jgi:hypothetical protein